MTSSYHEEDDDGDAGEEGEGGDNNEVVVEVELKGGEGVDDGGKEEEEEVGEEDNAGDFGADYEGDGDYLAYSSSYSAGMEGGAEDRLSSSLNLEHSRSSVDALDRLRCMQQQQKAAPTPPAEASTYL